MIPQSLAAGQVVSPQILDDDRMSSSGPSSESTKKRRRKEDAGPRKKERRLTQRGLCDLNVDELYIIFAYVYPMDLLNLARTCKSLRGILMHKSSLFLWKAAFLRVEGLPPCPADLTEPQYTNLVFHPRCHGCGKTAHTILWRMRRRYCPACRKERLCSKFSYWDAIPAMTWEYPGDSCKIGKGKWVDQDQMESFVREYNQSSDKAAFLNEKLKQCQAISLHAWECEQWQRQNGRVHRHDLELLRKERGASIFQRLRQQGYGPEIAYFPEENIQRAKPAFFKTHKSLTDNEWNQMWPELVEIMDGFRNQRLNSTVYRPRRLLLLSKYDQYVTHRPSDVPTFDLLPHVADLDRFPPFQNVIKAPEEAQMDGEPFASAFSQLAVLVSEWKKQLDTDVAGLVQIPTHLFSDGLESSQTVAYSSVANAEWHRTDADKLRLACAVFYTVGSHCFTYPEVLFATTHEYYPSYREGMDTPKSVGHRIGMLAEAPYIVHACGLDPNVATADDMDRRNARLKCLSCQSRTVIIMDWRSAMLHALRRHNRAANLPPLSDLPRWQLISDEHIDAIMTAEESCREKDSDGWRRCLLCQPRVGDSLGQYDITSHMRHRHSVDVSSVKESIHYKRFGITNEYSSRVEMVEEGGEVSFRKSWY